MRLHSRFGRSVKKNRQIDNKERRQKMNYNFTLQIDGQEDETQTVEFDDIELEPVVRDFVIFFSRRVQSKIDCVVVSRLIELHRFAAADPDRSFHPCTIYLNLADRH